MCFTQDVHNCSVGECVRNDVLLRFMDYPIFVGL